MKVIEIEYKFLVFLYAYLRQIDLSLDRSRWETWSSLKEYFKFQIDPLKTLDELLRISKLRPGTNPIVFLVKKPSFFVRLREFLLKIVIRKCNLYDVEILHCCQMLRQFNALLNQDFSRYPLEAEKLRIDIARFYSFILEPKMFRKDLDKAMKVEHFMQSENLSTIGIDVFAKDILLR
jgi:hypothetical protein